MENDRVQKIANGLQTAINIGLADAYAQGFKDGQQKPATIASNEGKSHKRIFLEALDAIGIEYATESELDEAGVIWTSIWVGDEDLKTARDYGRLFEFEDGQIASY